MIGRLAKYEADRMAVGQESTNKLVADNPLPPVTKTRMARNPICKHSAAISSGWRIGKQTRPQHCETGHGVFRRTSVNGNGSSGLVRVRARILVNEVGCAPKVPRIASVARLFLGWFAGERE